MAAAVKSATSRAWIVYGLGRLLQVTGLLVTLVAATAFFGTPSTLAMLRMMLMGVILFIPGWILVELGGAAPRPRPPLAPPK